MTTIKIDLYLSSEKVIYVYFLVTGILTQKECKHKLHILYHDFLNICHFSLKEENIPQWLKKHYFL